MGPDAMILLFWMLSFKPAFHSPLSPSSGGKIVPLHFLPLEWYHLYIWGCWYFSWPAWFQLVLHLAWHFTWCILQWGGGGFSHWVVSNSCDRMDCSLLGSSVPRILQARTEGVAISFSRGSSQPTNWTQVSCIAGRFFTTWTRREAPHKLNKQSDSVQPCHTPCPVLNQSVHVWFWLLSLDLHTGLKRQER